MPRLARYFALCLAIVPALGLVAVESSTPANAVGCWGNYCSGTDPHATGCDADAVTIAHAYIPSTWSPVELRWSPTCKTEWARVSSGYGRYYPWALRAVQSTGYRQVGVVASNSAYSWSRQIYSPRLCVYASWTGPPGPVGTSCV